MKAVTRFFGGLIVGFFLASPTTYASSKFEGPSSSELEKAFRQATPKLDHDVLQNALKPLKNGQALEETRPIDGANPCFPKTVQEQLPETVDRKFIFPAALRRIAALSATDPEFKKQVEEYLRLSRAWKVDPGMMLSHLIRPEMGLNQHQVAKALEVYRGILASNTSRIEEQSANEALQAAGVPKDFIPLLRKINAANGVEHLTRQAKAEKVSLSQILVWMSDPLLPVPNPEVLAKMESAIDEIAAKDLAEAFRKNLQARANDTLDSGAAKDALKGWNQEFSQADVEKLGKALRQLQKADATEGPQDTGLSTIADLAKQAGFYELLPKLLGQTAGDACFVNDHTASRQAKLEPLKKELIASLKAKAKVKSETKTKTETQNTDQPADSKKLAETRQALGEKLKGLQDFMANFGRSIVQRTPAAQKLAGMKTQPTSTETKGDQTQNTDDKSGQAASPTEEVSGTQFPAALTEGEIKLLSEGVPTLVMWKNGQPNPKLEAIQKAIEKVDPKLGDKASEDEAAAVIAKFLGTLTAEQRTQLAERAKQDIAKAEKLKTDNPRLLWLAQRMAWGAGIAAGDKAAADKNPKFTAAFTTKWNESKEAGQKFYQWIAEMDDPAKRLNAIQKLQNSYDKEAAVKWASVHYGSSNPTADKAARKFMEALTAGADGKPTQQLAQTVWVDGKPETKLHDLGATPETRWKKIKELASSRDGFAYAPRVTAENVAHTPPVVNPPVAPPVAPPVQPPTQPVQPQVNPVAANFQRAMATTVKKIADANEGKKCSACHDASDGIKNIGDMTSDAFAVKNGSPRSAKDVARAFLKIDDMKQFLDAAEITALKNFVDGTINQSPNQAANAGNAADRLFGNPLAE